MSQNGAPITIVSAFENCLAYSNSSLEISFNTLFSIPLLLRGRRCSLYKLTSVISPFKTSKSCCASSSVLEADLTHEFTYKICEDDFIPSIPKKVPKTSNKLNIQKAYMQWPVKGPSSFSKDIFATSYVWGVLNDSRIIKE